MSIGSVTGWEHVEHLHEATDELLVAYHHIERAATHTPSLKWSQGSCARTMRETKRERDSTFDESPRVG